MMKKKNYNKKQKEEAIKWCNDHMEDINRISNYRQNDEEFKNGDQELMREFFKNMEIKNS